MGYIVLLVDDLQVNGATVDNGGFESGVLTPWSASEGEIFDPPMLLDSTEYPGDQYEGNYSVGLIPYPDVAESNVVITYNLGACATTDVITFKYMINYATNEGANTVGLGASLYEQDTYDYWLPANFTNGYYDGTYPDTTEWIEATINVSDMGFVDGTHNITFEVYSYQYSDIPPEETAIAITLQFDDIELYSGAPWYAFTNGDFETGNLDNWTITGSATTSTEVVHSGTKSCYLTGTDNGIKQRIDLTGVEELDIYYNITYQGGFLRINIDTLASTTVLTLSDYYGTSGWVRRRIDVSALTDVHILDITTYGASVYIDDITTLTTFDDAPLFYTLENDTWFNTTSSYDCTSSYPLTSGIDGSRCLYLNPDWGWGTTQTASAYTYCDLTHVNSITFQYKIPSFNPGYLNIGGAYFVLKLEKAGSPTITQIIADADNGAITDWTEYSIDVSGLSGTYKLTLYGETTDTSYGLHPYADIYIDNIHMPIVINIQQSFYMRHQYDTDNRYLDGNTTHILQTLRSLPPDWMFTHRLNDVGHIIGYDEMSMTDLGNIHRVINLYNILHMKVRRVK